MRWDHGRILLNLVVAFVVVVVVVVVAVVLLILALAVDLVNDCKPLNCFHILDVVAFLSIVVVVVITIAIVIKTKCGQQPFSQNYCHI